MTRVCGSVQLGRCDDAVTILVKPAETSAFHAEEFGAGDALITIGVGTAQAVLASWPAITASTTFGTVTAFGTITPFTTVATTHGTSLLAFRPVSSARLMHRPHTLADWRLVGRIEIAIAIAIHPLEHVRLQGIDFCLRDRAIAIGVGQTQHHRTATFAVTTGAVMATATGLGIGSCTGHDHGRSG
tara:strand:+ start:323 stop:880 length:558 start_codon:yes stop_codon:yes gene_type:complete